MKINILPIFVDHFSTLRNARNGKYSKFDFFVFYALPICAAVTPWFYDIRFDNSFYTLSITFFGIFIALLLNVQVAIFSIFQRKWDKPTDENLATIQAAKLDERRILLGELNANLSYLILFSCLALVAFLSFFVFDFLDVVLATVTVGLYSHFVLTLMMSVKRAHTLFQMEYEGHV